MRQTVKKPDIELDPVAESTGESYFPQKKSTSGMFKAWQQRAETPGGKDVVKSARQARSIWKFWKLSSSQDSDSDTEQDKDPVIKSVEPGRAQE